MSATPPPLTLSSPILIIGAGTFGLSTALHLARRKYTSITVLDPHPPPSPLSAGNDINKVVQSVYKDKFTKKLAKKALEGWRTDPVFRDAFHETGILFAADDSNMAALEEELDGLPNRGIEVNGRDEFRAIIPILSGEMNGWKGSYQKEGCGWVHAADALRSCVKACKELGVTFISGPAGTVTSLIYSPSSSPSPPDILGAKSSDGTEYLATRTILAAGAWSSTLFPFHNQLLAKCWTLAHIQLTESERARFRDAPVLLHVVKGFFFEPDAVRGEVKVCNEHPGYTSYTTTSTPRSSSSSSSSEQQQQQQQQQSVPFHRHSIPLECEAAIRDLLAETVPEWSSRPFTHARICWCTDTPDRAFLITPHPTHPRLQLATGDSGHGFKHLPSIGSYIADSLEGVLEMEMEERWRWRPETVGEGRGGEGEAQGRYGGAGRVRDLSEVEGWVRLEQMGVEEVTDGVAKVEVVW
ncbi:hypothetical protein YB2330_000834 [Saitoella coloradoensis]